MTIGYCPNCKTNTLMKKDDFSLLLAFILAFTGIGLVIYILYHLDKKPNRCVHCDSICELKHPDTTEPKLQDNSNGYLEYSPIKTKVPEVSYCHNCGTEIKDREGIKYCALCGSGIE
ncbi:MAG: hypothetical protein ACFFAO_05285 [Candidatus Hermodarchaeota archaeon]